MWSTADISKVQDDLVAKRDKVSYNRQTFACGKHFPVEQRRMSPIASRGPNMAKVGWRTGKNAAKALLRLR
jgi:hypothetical protein